VEDEPDHMHILTEWLTRAGYEVIQAYGGEAALRKVKRQRPDIVVTDLAMPELSGVGLITVLKSDPETRDIPIVAVTAYVWDTIAQAAGSCGCDVILGKPFRAQRLLSQVERLLRPRQAS